MRIKTESGYRSLPAPAVIALIAVLTACSDGNDNVSRQAGDVVAALCSPDNAVAIVGTVSNTEITETSGVVLSRQHSNLLWLHEDSGNALRLYALTRSGETKGYIELQVDPLEHPPGDTEDMAFGPGPETSADYLYLADIGNNLKAESKLAVTIHRIREPDLAGKPDNFAELTEEFETFTLTYPDGPHDAETFLVDPVSGESFVITKEYDFAVLAPGPARIYRAPGGLLAGQNAMLDFVGSIDFPGFATRGLFTGSFGPLGGFETLATGGDISADGSLIAVRTYHAAWLWRRENGQSIAEALAAAPCEINTASEAQGEALGIYSDEGEVGIYTLSEGLRVPLNVTRANR